MIDERALSDDDKEIRGRLALERCYGILYPLWDPLGKIQSWAGTAGHDRYVEDLRAADRSACDLADERYDHSQRRFGKRLWRELKASGRYGNSGRKVKTGEGLFDPSKDFDHKMGTQRVLLSVTPAIDHISAVDDARYHLSDDPEAWDDLTEYDRSTLPMSEYDQQPGSLGAQFVTEADPEVERRLDGDHTAEEPRDAHSIADPDIEFEYRVRRNDRPTPGLYSGPSPERLEVSKKLDECWKARLTPEHYDLLREAVLEARTLEDMAGARGISKQAMRDRFETAKRAAKRAIPDELPPKVHTGKRGRPADDTQGIEFAALMRVKELKAEARARHVEKLKAQARAEQVTRVAVINP